jgi:hypothetical protein
MRYIFIHTTNYVLDEIHLTSSFSFLLQVLKEILFHLSSRSKGVKTKKTRGGEEERTNPFLYFVTARFLEGHLQKW